jgi:hypothetical protein
MMDALTYLIDVSCVLVTLLTFWACVILGGWLADLYQGGDQ